MTSKQLGDFDVFNFGKSFPFAIGFDRTLQLLERANQSPTNTNYPPYNIVKHDAENFSIELALAGFDKKDITISKEKEVLNIEGKQKEGENLSMSIEDLHLVHSKEHSHLQTTLSLKVQI